MIGHWKRDVVACLCLAALHATVLTHTRADDLNSNQIRFDRDIQPIFAKHCLLCHGVDEAEGGLQLHSSDTAMAAADSGMRAIVPGNLDQSELLKRIVSDEVDHRMPPEGDRLTESEVQQLRDWIEQGANWTVHWAYAPISESPVSDLRDNSWSKQDMDRYVLAQLERQGITPSPQAEKTTLIKRLYYDLIGLPPTPDEVSDYLRDTSEDAYPRLVQRLLASDHFGERWGRHWLDKARYADSDGYEKDNHRADAWRYRDWVIQAINDDLPFDQFTIQQLAGDMLAESSADDKLATAFHRQTLTNTEGGTDREQWRVAAVMDRTETLGTVWLGLSVGCARCHSHKYDQITQQEYYQLYAYFNNGDEANADIPKSAERYASLTQELDSAKGLVNQRRDELVESIEVWSPSLRKQALAISADEIQVHALENTQVRGPEGVLFTELDDGSFLVSGDNPDSAKYTIEGTTDVSKVTGIRLEVLPHDSLNAKGPGRTAHGNFVLNEVRLYASSEPAWTPDQKKVLADATADFSQEGWAVAGAIDGVEGVGKSGTGWAISPKFGSPHTATFALDQPLEPGESNLQIVLNQTYGSQHTVGRFRVHVVTGRLPGTGMPEEIRSILIDNKRDAKSVEMLVAYQQAHDPPSAELSKKLQGLEEKLAAETMKVRVISERSSGRRETRVLRRGEFKQPEDLVQPDTLTTLPPIRSRNGAAATDRLDLAMWLVSGDNPIVPRVAVNHLWHHLFGSGIVPTMNDFGVRGDSPSHPELLDHLAAKFISEGWSRKKMIEYIVNSATYQQSSSHRPELVDLDPRNRWLHRQNRFRVEAEVMRDIALSVSGLLSEKVGGPSVFPPIPPSVTDLTYNSSFNWKTSAGEDRYRRGLYTYFKRTAPHPNLITFDCPDSNVSNVQRERSNTPIGALVTLNNETFVEAAQGMARLLLNRSDLKTDNARLRYAMRLCIARVPDSEELADFDELLRASRQWYSSHPEEAVKMIGQMGSNSVDTTENAAWVATLRMILNLDEFITRE